MKSEGKEMIMVRDALREAKCRGYEQCLQDMVKQFKRVQDRDPMRVREEVRRFVKIHTDPEKHEKSKTT